MKKSKKIRGLCLLLCGVMLFALPGCGAKKYVPEPESVTSKATENTEESSAPISELNRASNEKQAEELQKQYQQNPSDQAVALEYAQQLFALGDFSESKEMLKPLLEVEKPLPDAIYLSAQIEYLNGNYAQAEKLYNTLVKQYPDQFKEKAEAELLMTYYQTNQYQKSNQLFIGQEEVNNIMLDMMKAFGDATPYQMDWNGKEKTIIPFITTEPLPVIPIEINGERINAFIDTGGPMLIVDEAIAAKLGIKTVSNDLGIVEGGTIDVGFGKADSMKLGEVKIKNIPVSLLSFEGISNAFEGYATDVHAVIGTNVFQQFLPIMDYPSGQLILILRNGAAEGQLSELLANDNVLEEVPFTLASTHYMFAKGYINGYAGLNMFVDSGATDVDVGLPIKTMDLLHIPIPELNSVPGVVADSNFEQGLFNLPSCGLGNLIIDQGIGKYDTSGHSDGWYDTNGFVGDALIGHNYLKNYKWTIDFDSMKMIFSEQK